MYVKKIVPIQISNGYAIEFIATLPIVLGNFAVRHFRIEFHDKDGNPLLQHEGEVSGLPFNEKLVENVNPHTFDYCSPEATQMFDAQDKIVLDEIKKQFGLTYYDDTFTIDNTRDFSYTTYVNLTNEEDIGKIHPL